MGKEKKKGGGLVMVVVYTVDKLEKAFFPMLLFSMCVIASVVLHTVCTEGRIAFCTL